MSRQEQGRASLERTQDVRVLRSLRGPAGGIGLMDPDMEVFLALLIAFARSAAAPILGSASISPSSDGVVFFFLL